MKKRGFVRAAISVLTGLVVSAGGAGTVVAGLLSQGPTSANPVLALSHEATGLAGGLETQRAKAAPLASLGVFQTDTSRSVESAWVGMDLSTGPGSAVSPPALLVPMGLAAIAAERSRALASGAVGAPPDSTTGRPSDDFSYLGLGPTTFAILRSGKPAGGLEQWSHSSQTSLSYVQPHRQLEFVVKFFGEKKAEPGDSLSAAPIQSQAQLVDNLHVDIDSANMSLRSQEYGRIDTQAEHKEPPSGRMVAIGLDLGLLPAVVGNVALNSELIIGRSSNPGFYLGLATNVGIPAERGSSKGAPDQPYRPPYDLGGGSGGGGGLNFGSGDGGGAGATGGGGGGSTPFTPLIPIVPLTPTPEPGTLLLVAFGSAWLVARRRAGK